MPKCKLLMLFIIKSQNIYVVTSLRCIFISNHAFEITCWKLKFLLEKLCFLLFSGSCQGYLACNNRKSDILPYSTIPLNFNLSAYRGSRVPSNFEAKLVATWRKIAHSASESRRSTIVRRSASAFRGVNCQANWSKCEGGSTF